MRKGKISEILEYCPFCMADIGDFEILDDTMEHSGGGAWPSVSFIWDIECKICGAELRVAKTIEVEIIEKPSLRGHWTNY